MNHNSNDRIDGYGMLISESRYLLVMFFGKGLLPVGLALCLFSITQVLADHGQPRGFATSHPGIGSVNAPPFTIFAAGPGHDGFIPVGVATSGQVKVDSAGSDVPFEIGQFQDVRKAGAVGDGQQDDTAAIQACIGRGGAIVFPPGAYRITRPLEVNLAETGWVSFHGFGTARLQMAGAGPAIRFLGTHTGSADPKRVHPGVWQHERFPVVEGIEIVGDHPEASGIEAIQTMQLTIANTLIRQTFHGIRLHQRNRNVILSHCHIYENRGIGVFLDDVDLHQINIVGCHISYNAAGGIVVRKGYLRNLQVSGCDIEANMSVETEPTANILIDSRESEYGHAEIAITGCTIQHYSKVPGSTNVRFFGQDAKGRLWGNLTIAENVLSDVERNIEIIGARGVCITGNTFWGAVAEDLLITDSRNIVVGPNTFDQNPNYAHQGPYQGGVCLRNCNDCTLNGLQFADVQAPQAALLVQNCHGINIINCQFTDCGPAGILLDQVTDSRVSDCIIRVAAAGSQTPPSGTEVPAVPPADIIAIRGIGLQNVMIRGNLLCGKIDLPDSGVHREANLELPPLP